MARHGRVQGRQGSHLISRTHALTPSPTTPPVASIEAESPPPSSGLDGGKGSPDLASADGRARPKRGRMKILATVQKAFGLTNASSCKLSDSDPAHCLG
jgi:hypothetical protein